MVTIKDVAKAAGVSISTVSNALNNMSNVGEDTRQRILEIANQMNYVPNLNARRMKNHVSNTVGLFLPNVQSSFYVMLIRAIHERCRERKFSLIVHISNSYTSEKLSSTILSANIDGAIILDEHLKNEESRLLESRTMPLVFLDKHLCAENISSVLIDNEMGCEQAMDFLVRSGHKRIAYIRGSDNYDGQVRYDSYRRLMTRYQLPVDERWVLNGNFQEKVAYPLVAQTLSLMPGRLPDAFLCANDAMAIGCIRALHEAGYRVPEDVSVFGFDDGDEGKYCDPKLTTIHVPVTEMGQKAVRELFRLMQPYETGAVTLQETRLVVRESCTFRR